MRRNPATLRPGWKPPAGATWTPDCGLPPGEFCLRQAEAAHSAPPTATANPADSAAPSAALRERLRRREATARADAFADRVLRRATGAGLDPAEAADLAEDARPLSEADVEALELGGCAGPALDRYVAARNEHRNRLLAGAPSGDK